MAVDIDKIKEKMKQLKERNKGDVDYIDLTDGDNLLRIAPGLDDTDFFQEAGYHYIARGSKEKKTYLCRKLSFGEPCFFCDMTSELRKTKQKADKDLAKEWGGKYRVFMNAVDRADHNKIKVLGCGSQIFEQILGFIADEDWGDMTDPETGYDIVINRTGEGMETEYTVRPRPKRSPIGVDLGEVKLFDLKSFLENAMTYEEQEADFTGEGAAQGEEEKPDKPPATKTAATKTAVTKTATKAATKAEPEKPKEEPKTDVDQDELTRLIGLLDLEDAGVMALFKKWKTGNGTIEGLKKMMELLDIDTAPKKEEEPPAETTGADALDDMVAKALEDYRKNKVKK